MDEEIADPTPGTSGKKTNPKKPKKKPISSKEKTDKAAASAEPPKEKKRTMMDLVHEAIEVSGEGRKGASVQAIKKYIKSKHGPEAPNFNSLVNKALAKGIEKGTLERPPASKDALGAVGYFRLAKVKVEAPKRTTKIIKRQKTDEHSSDSEITQKPSKPNQRKRNLSDTYIEEMRGSVTSTPKPSVKQISASKDINQTKNVAYRKKANDKDTSDTKIVVKKTRRKSMKSYSSDTEVDFKMEKVTKAKKEPLKKAKSDKPKTEKAELLSKASKTKVKKLYNSAEEKENEMNTKSGKTRSKKQP